MGTSHCDFTPVLSAAGPAATTDQRLRTLGDVALLRHLGPLRERALRLGLVRHAADKALVFRRDEPGGSLLLVLAGRVRLFGPGRRDAVELSEASPGDVFGEAEVLDGRAVRRLTAVASGPAELLEFARELLLADGALPPALADYLTAVHRQRQAAPSASPP